MKLSIEKHRIFVILGVSEGISLNDASVLQAGVDRTLRMDKLPLVLDLSQAKPEPDALPTLLGLQLVAFKADIDIIVVSGDPRLGQFVSLKDATQFLISGAPLAPIRENILLLLTQQLDAKLDELIKKKEALLDKYVLKDNLPRDNERLQNLFSEMLKHGEILLKSYDPMKPPVVDDGVFALEKSIADAIRDGQFLVKDHLKLGLK